MAKWLLIDGYNFIFRSYYAVSELSRSDGFPTNAIHGWVRTLWRLEDSQQPDRMVVFYDLGGDVRREKLYPDYKATRSKCPEELSLQIPWIKDLAEAMGYGRVEKKGVEADDLIGACARRLSGEGHKVLMVSADKDLAQCVAPGSTQLLPPPTVNPRLGWRELDEEGVREKFGVTPRQIPDYLALVGDTSDNIPGLPGVGPKTAARWLTQYRDIDGIIMNCGQLKPLRFQSIVHKSEEVLRRNLLLTTLDTGIADIFLEPEMPDPAKLASLLETLEMKTALAAAARRYGFQTG